MIGAVAAAAAPALSPAAVVARYTAALAALREPAVFVFEYTLLQTGPRVNEQTHRVFRSKRDERDETLAVNGTRSTRPVVRIFRRPYRYSVAALAPRPAAYVFAYRGTRRDGKHADYAFALSPKASPAPAFAFTQVIVDGVTFLPQSVAFRTSMHGGRGTVTFGKAERWWVARSAYAEASVAGGVSHETIGFGAWRFPPSLPPSTFTPPRAAPTARPAVTT